MISDKERREVANELREAANTKGKRSGSMELMLSKLLGITKKDVDVFGKPIDVATTWRDVYRKLAELIDRPTCSMSINFDYDEDCPAYYRDYACSRCGGDFIWYRHESINYCPKCGAEVVE